MEVIKEDLLGSYFDRALEETIKMVSIPSYRRNLEKGTPVHEDIVKALDFALNLCKEFGWETFKDEKNRYAYADIKGKSDKLFGIICHLDVVPAGNLEEWNTEPFKAVIKDGKLIGRGAFDDKGPTMVNMFAMKYLLDNGFTPDYTIRFIFGTSEETTWECMEAYVENERIVDAGYVPDAEFPVVFAEKWISDWDLKGKFDSEFSLIGGEVYNAVCDLVKYKGPKMDEIKAYLDKNKIKNVVEGDTLTIKGVAAHGSLPEKGVNAATWAAAAIHEVGIYHPATEFIAKNSHLNYNMEQVFGDLTDETGSLTQCIGMVNINSNNYKFTYNFRVPCTTDPIEQIEKVFINYASEKGIEALNVSLEDKVYFPKDSEIVTKIMSVYREVTGDVKSQPLAIGGGTFAKSMPNLIAFGAEFNIDESTMHAYNEYVTIDDLKKMMEIYAKSIIKLTTF